VLGVKTTNYTDYRRNNLTIKNAQSGLTLTDPITIKIQLFIEYTVNSNYLEKACKPIALKKLSKVQ